MTLDSFLSFLKHEKRYSIHTVDAYARDLRQFISYLTKNSDLELLQATHHEIRGWMVSLMGDQKCGARSVNRKLSALKSFYKYQRKRGLITENPATRLIAPKVGKKVPRTIQVPQMESLLDGEFFPNDFEGARDQLIIALFYETGIRLQELITIKTSSIDRESRIIRITGKGSKQRQILYSEKLEILLFSYLKQKKDLPESDNLILFVTSKGKAIYPRLVQRMLDKYLGMVTSSQDRNPHVLRHTFATSLMDRGADINAIKHLLGHSSLGSTQVYTHSSIEKLRETYFRTHPKSK